MDNIECYGQNAQTDANEEQESFGQSENPGENLPPKGKKPGFWKTVWRSLYPPVLYEMLMVLFLLLFTRIIRMAGGSDSLILRSSMWATGLAAAVMIPLGLFLIHRDNRKRQVSDVFSGKMTGRQVLWMILLGASLCYVLNLLVAILNISNLFPAYSQEYNDVMISNSFAVSILCGSILGPIAEEVVFRGLIHQRIRDAFGVVPAVICSAVLFGIFHGNMVQFIYAGLMGLFLSYFMEYFHSLVAPMLLHVFANLWSFVLAYFGMNWNNAGILILLNLVLILQILFVIFSIIWLITKHRRQKKGT